MEISTINALIAAAALLIGAVLGTSVQRYIADKARTSNKFVTKLELYNKLYQSLEEVIKIQVMSCTIVTKDKTICLGEDLLSSEQIIRYRESLDYSLGEKPTKSSFMFRGISDEHIRTIISNIDMVFLIVTEETRKELLYLKKILRNRLSKTLVNGVPSGLHKIHKGIGSGAPVEDDLFVIKEVARHMIFEHYIVAKICMKIQSLLYRELQ